ncbi:unnamed protein product [Plutella xylostella]|uniref:Dysbindin domain-containing protein 1 n=1 Tax=Plutella xylostella TaxID=51655 RepID=A0A8S4F953_PLUXY|nr:unnamed protein product [Plutella xylostella]
MLGNLKDFISVVQDGLSTNTNLRQTLQEVQKVKNIFKEKHKPSSECLVNYGAGGELLEKYQESWSELHQHADENAKAAEEVDKVILELHETAKKRLQNANEMAQNLANLPNLTSAVAQCMNSLKNVQALIKSVEDDLVEFEDIIERSNMEKWKLDHHYHLSLYKTKKLAALEETRHKLAKENTDKSSERERRQLAELQYRQEASGAQFQVDVQQYLATGSLPPGPTLPPKLSLEQVQLDDDPSDLEKFLDS